MAQRRILVTGAYGLIGNLVFDHLRRKPEEWDLFGLSRRRGSSKRLPEDRRVEIPDDRLRIADMTDADAVRRAVRGMDGVIHMAADPRGDADWESVLTSNIAGSYNLFEACRQAGVKRVVYASSVMVSFGVGSEPPYDAIFEGRAEDIHEPVPLVKSSDPPRPTDLYSAGKLFGEALARVHADRYGMSCICLRIGWVLSDNRPRPSRLRSDWCSHRDIARLVERCIGAPESIRFAVYYGVSNNRFRWVDLSNARDEVGFVPLDRAEDRQ